MMPPPLPPLPAYEPPPPLPALPEDPMKAYNDKKYEEDMLKLQQDVESTKKRVALETKAPMLYTRQEARSVSQSKGLLD